jgi:mycothiol system anti-sigma-R factor
MRCEETMLGLYALADGELDGAERDEVLTHLEGCPRCLREYESDRRLKALVRDAVVSALVAPPALWSNVARRIEVERAREHPRAGRAVWRMWRRRWALPLVSAGLAACVVFAITLLPRKESVAFLGEEIIADHLGSVMRASGPVDVPSPDPAMIIARFRERIRAPARVPTLARDGIRLVGGSFCELSSTRGLRWTYVLGNDRALSFYQLERGEGVRFPRAGAERVYLDFLGRQERPRIVLWGDERFVYALAGELSGSEIRRLASLF